jgi:signal recognition particle receptor subunit beta
LFLWLFSIGLRTRLELEEDDAGWHFFHGALMGHPGARKIPHCQQFALQGYISQRGMRWGAGSNGVVIVFDLTADKSLRDAREWLRMARTNCGKGIPTIVLGNKVDLVK